MLPHQSRWVKVTAVIPVEAFAVFDEARGKLQREYGITHANEPVLNGMVIEVLAAEYLAG